MSRLAYSEVVRDYRFDPVSACVPTEGIRKQGDSVEPVFPTEYVDLFHGLITRGVIRA